MAVCALFSQNCGIFLPEDGKLSSLHYTISPESKQMTKFDQAY